MLSRQTALEGWNEIDDKIRLDGAAWSHAYNKEGELVP